MSYEPIAIPNLAFWREAMTATGLVKAKLVNTPYKVIYEPWKCFSRWTLDAGSQVQKHAIETKHGPCWKMSCTTGQNVRFHMGYATNNNNFTKVIKLKEKWYIAYRLRIQTPSVFPIANEKGGLFLESTYQGGSVHSFGFDSATSTTKWSIKLPNGTLLSSKNMTNQWTLFESWSDSTNIYLQITDDNGTETAQAYGSFSSENNTPLGPSFYFLPGASASMSVILDNLLMMTSLQTG
jgi:hypothetical protein